MREVQSEIIQLEPEDMCFLFKVGKKLIFKVKIVDLIATLTGKSNSEIKRLIGQRAIDLSIIGKTKEE